MAVLDNQRWELFAQKIAAGESTVRAYELAGFKRSRSNAVRLRANEVVAARILELRQACAAGCQITVESICRELDEAISIARAKGQAQPLVNAAALRAKLAGLGVEKQQVEVIDANPFAETTCAQDVLAKVAAELGERTARILAEAFEIEFTAVNTGPAVNTAANGAPRAIEDWQPPKADRKRELG